MGLRVPFALVPFGFNSPIKFIIVFLILYVPVGAEQKCEIYTRKNAQAITNMQTDWIKSVPTACQQDVFALPITRC